MTDAAINSPTTFNGMGKASVPPFLKSINYTLSEENLGSSEDDEGFNPEDLDLEDSGSVIGVSISKAQTHMKSPKTPAAEKAAAIEERGGFFSDRFDIQGFPIANQSTSPDSNVILRKPAESDKCRTAEDGKDNSVSPPPKLPSPWRAGPKTFERNSETTGILKQGFDKSGRRRASSGPEKRMKIPLNLPTLSKTPRFFGGGSNDDDQSKGNQVKFKEQRKGNAWQDLPQFDGVAWRKESWGQLVARARAWSGANEKLDDSDWSLTPTAEERQTISPARENQAAQRPSLGLRRATSDNSLYLTRTLSKASSLGDDSRFEHIHEQVNSRGKAIRDSFQDSNFRLSNLSLPKPSSIFSLPKTNLFQGGDGSRGSWARLSAMLPPDSSSRDVSRSPERTTGAQANANPAKSTKAAGMNAANAAAHPNFTAALENLTGDIVILGGYRGSVLREAKAPHRRLWVPIKVGLNLRKVDLEVGFEDEDEERAPEKIIPDGMLTHIGPVDISKRLFKRLRSCENARNGTLRVHDYGYDWRLSPHRLSREIIKFLEGLPCNAPGVPPEKRGAIMIAHSLGGILTRHAVNQRPELFSGVIYAGVPSTCANVLGPIRNGDDVLFSSKVLTAQVNFSIRTSFAFLPLDGRCFIDKDTKEEYPVDFFDVNDWIKYRFSPCTDPPLPTLPAPGRMNSIMGQMSSMIPDSLSNAMPSISFKNRGDSVSTRNNVAETKDVKDAATSHHKMNQAESSAEGHFPNTGMAPQMGSNNAVEDSTSPRSGTSNPITGNVLPRSKAIEYLSRILPEIKRFRQELAHQPRHQSNNTYPPFAVVYGKSVPTVLGAKVRGRDGIARADAYDDLAFASGDGVVLARAAMLTEGFRAARGGVVASERGHVTLLGDLEAVGKCLNALRRARRKGVGLGVEDQAEAEVGLE